MADTPSRKLAVLLHADVVGSTSLVRLNETLAHERIKDAFVRLSESVRSYSGTTHELRGDALVAEFGRASDAVCAAIAFQDANTALNASLEDDVRPRLRVGIAMGEVIVADNTITGDGVVLAQRLEQIAEPGGVCIQGAAYETVPKRLPFAFESLGEQTLKGFDEPVRAYLVSLRGGEVVPEPEFAQTNQLVRQLSGKSSIAVLPFTNMSGDAEQDYFSDGITEDIITEVSRFPSLFVIARNSTFSYKGTQIDIKEVSRSLGVQYILEGSVRRAGKRLRITAQVIEAESGVHVWAERYDRDLEDLFEVQDEVTGMIASALPGRIDSDRVAQSQARKPSQFGAYDYLLRAYHYINRFRPGDFEKARESLQLSLELDSKQARTYAGLAWCDLGEYITWVAVEPEISLARAFENAERAVSLNDLDGECHRVLGNVQMFRRQYDASEKHNQRALFLNPNDAAALAIRGLLLACLGRAEDAEAALREAMRHDPHYPDYNLWVLGIIYYTARRYEDAVDALVAIGDPNFSVRRWLAASYAQLNKMSDAQRAANALMEVMPDFTINRALSTFPYKNLKDIEHHAEGMRKAGLPE